MLLITTVLLAHGGSPFIESIRRDIRLRGYIIRT